MMGDVRSISTGLAPAPVSEDVIERLEFLLAEARAGRIVQIAYGGVMPDGAVIHGSTAGDKGHLLLASVSYLQASLAAPLDD